MLEPPPYHSIENEEFLHSFYSFCTFVALINGKKLNYATVFLKLLESESLLNLFKLYILRENNADVILLINLKSKTVCYRKSKTCDLDVGKLAEKLADGGGHEAAAGSLLNDTIINITKLLQPIEL